jgi:hypothetical protein
MTTASSSTEQREILRRAGIGSLVTPSERVYPVTDATKLDVD